MSIKTFIDRPVTSVMTAVSLVIVGIIALFQLPLEQYPSIAPPTVKVAAAYTGASAETMMKSVVAPLEASINGVEDMQYMTSTAANNGTCTITIVFKQGADPNMAVVNVQNRVASAQGQLPQEVVKGGVTIRKTQSSNLKFITLYSPDGRYDAQFLTNYMKINIEPRLARIPGVGEVNVFGVDYSLRIWLDPAKMKAYGLVPKDIGDVLAAQNLESATGSLGAESGGTFQYVLRYRGRYDRVPDYENIVLKASAGGNVLRLRDVARVEMGSVNYDLSSTTLGLPGASAGITQIAGSNAADIIAQMDQVEDDVRRSLPPGMVLEDQTSVMDFLGASIRNVVDTLWIALVLVVIVVALFLRDWRSTLIPTIAIVVSLIGTFAFIYVVGFTLNLLTLFALVLVIGTVVDDSIVVVEAVQAKLAEGGRSVREAVLCTMKELRGALSATTIVFMAVFVPVSFMSGTTGVFYKEFGLTMAAAVAISLANALTLCPALCSIMLRAKKTKAGTPAHGGATRVVLGYERGIVWALRHKRVVLPLVPIAVGLLVLAAGTAKTGLVPQEDMGTIDVGVQCRPGYSLAHTKVVMDEVEAHVRTIPQIKIYTRVDGRDAQQNQTPSAGFLSIRLKPWAQRTARRDDIDSVVNDIYRRTACIKEAKVNCSTLPMIRGYGSSSGFELYVQNRSADDYGSLAKVAGQLIDRLNRRPEIFKAHTNFDMSYPQYEVTVDAAKCMMDGVSPKDVLDALACYVGGDYASNLNAFTKIYRVMVQASAQFRLNEQSLSNMYVRSADGSLSPLSGYVSLRKTNGPEHLTHFNMFPGIRVNGTSAPGYSSGEALQAIAEEAAATLPQGYGYELGGLSREESAQGNTTMVVILLSMVFVYIILSSLYESLLTPFAILLVVLFALLGSFAMSALLGIENNIYMQTGLIMLIGMVAKTAILLTEAATERRRERGMSVSAAALAAARLRFRPIIMTTTVMVFGMLPLLFSSGAGARGDLSIGAGVLGGMVVGTAALLFLVPVLFCLLQRADERLKQRLGFSVKVSKD